MLSVKWHFVGLSVHHICMEQVGKHTHHCIPRVCTCSQTLIVNDLRCTLFIQYLVQFPGSCLLANTISYDDSHTPVYKVL